MNVERRDFCIVALKLIQVTVPVSTNYLRNLTNFTEFIVFVIQTPDMELNALLKMLRSSDYVLQRFALQLEVEMAQLCEKGVEGLLELFDSLGKLMKPSLDHSLSTPALYKNSVLGLYVRRLIIFFEQLSFSQVVNLFEDYFTEFEVVMDEDNSRMSSTSKILGSSGKK